MITGQTVKNTYNGDGSTREFTITFEFADSSQVKFKVNGQEVTTNYSLNPVSKILTYPTVASELDPLTSADEIEIYRDTTITQDIEFNNGGPLNADMIEDGLDKLTMIAQEIGSKVKDYSAGKGIDISDEGVISLEGITVLDSADIDSLKEEGEYFVKVATCTSGLPSDLPTTGEKANTDGISGVRAYVKVIKTETEASYPTTKITQEVTFYGVSYGSNTTSYLDSYIREMSSGEGWSEYWVNYKINRKRAVACGAQFGSPVTAFIPEKLYPNTDYFIGNFIKEGNLNPDTIYPLSSLTLSDLPDSPYPITLYFKTDSTFSGITATDIVAWIGNTSLDTDSYYKITIENLVGTIEKLTVVE